MDERKEKCNEHPVPVKMTDSMRRQASRAAAHDDLTFGAYIKALITADLAKRRAEAEALKYIFSDEDE